MKRYLYVAGWVCPLVLLLVVSFASVTIGADAPKPAPAASQQNAKYITLAKCKMCHKPQATAWETTLHGKHNKQLPWEASDKPEVPAADIVYRHTTGYDATAKTWSEKGTSCEACHGAGGNHFMAAKDKRKLTITNPESLDTPGKKISVCGRCHGQYSIGDKRFPASFQPGQDLLKADGFKLDPVQPGKPMQEMNEVVTSEHFKHGVVCITCHSSHPATALPHSLKKSTNELCLDCHKDKDIKTHAPTAAADATCATCHMPDGAHTFTKPAK